MKNILIHGLGQNHNSWNETSKVLKKNNMEVICPDLFEISSGDGKEYKKLYNTFTEFCNNQNGKLNLCGLSLGGILALDYVREFPEKVNSIVVIGTPFEIPKTLFFIQSLIFRLMPSSNFDDMGCSKKDFITLVSSMSDLDIKRDLNKINCKSLILCGSKDAANMKSAKQINDSIKGSRFIVIENSAHEVNVDNPQKLASIIYDFWKEY